MSCHLAWVRYRQAGNGGVLDGGMHRVCSRAAANNCGCELVSGEPDITLPLVASRLARFG